MNPMKPYRELVELLFSLPEDFDWRTVVVRVAMSCPSAVLDAVYGVREEHLENSYGDVLWFTHTSPGNIDVAPSVWEFLEQGKLVAAVKEQRAIKGIPLKEAKAEVDEIIRKYFPNFRSN